MAPPVYSVRFADLSPLTVGDPYTVPVTAGRTFVLKAVYGYTGAVDLSTPSMIVQSQATGAEMIRFAPGATGNRYQQWDGMIVMPGIVDEEPAFVFIAQDGEWDVYASGYDFEGTGPV